MMGEYTKSLENKIFNLQNAIIEARRERDKLSNKVGQLESRLKEINDNYDEVSENCRFRKLEKYAELGRLAVEAINKFDSEDYRTQLCESSNVELGRGVTRPCNECLRAELLKVEVNKNASV